MRLEAVRIRRLRSIDDAALLHCGNFNVLIGKNNSGKSNLLTALAAFFSAVRNGTVLTLDPPLGRQPIDFYQNKTGDSILITCTFVPSLPERDQLLNEVVTDAPQMKHAAEGMDPGLRLSVTVSISHTPSPFAYVSAATLGGTTRPGATNPDPERQLLRVDHEAALAIREQTARARKLRNDVRGLQAILSRIDESISAFFMYDRLVFVEGPSDEGILRELGTKVGANFSQSNVGFVAIGGARNFGYFAAASTLAFLRKRGVKLWFVIDRDERELSEVQELRRALGDLAQLSVLDRRELENYLICPRAIAEFINAKVRATGLEKTEVKEGDVKSKLDECAERLRPFAIEKRITKIVCRPRYFFAKQVVREETTLPVQDRIRKEIERIQGSLSEELNRLGRVVDEQTRTVNDGWAGGKLTLVPGDLLLDLVCKEFGVRFKKERGDGVKLAAMLRPEEIDPEINRLLGEIVRA